MIAFRRWILRRAPTPGSDQNAGRTILRGGCRRAVALMDGAGLSAAPGGGPIVQPRVWRPHASHRKNRRFGSRASLSSCPRSEHQSTEGVNGQRNPLNMTVSFRGGPAPRLERRTRGRDPSGGSEPVDDERQAAHDEHKRRRVGQRNVHAGVGQHHDGEEHQPPRKLSHVSTVPRPGPGRLSTRAQASSARPCALCIT
jgi:hypothetical protein